MRKWSVRSSYGLLLLLSAVLLSCSSSASASRGTRITPEARLRGYQKQIKTLLVPAPAGWTIIRDYPRYVALTREIARLHPRHERGWDCIHYGEGSWTANTGNGFYGGLQMTYNWMRSIGGISGRANDYTRLEQMWAAERVSAQFHFWVSWMRGQWPNTYPPCAGYF